MQHPLPFATPENYLVDGLKAYAETKRFNYEIVVDPFILQEGPWPGKEQQLQKFSLLALQCSCDLEENRPAITEVAKQLRQIYQSASSNC
ncbi:conserved hypothetical protein [Ricinus communis]|uniref:Uncharacterized protein n=2 Tax=Ricinus communis TaxID=3988 RepID=B9RF80_RICCO|nr:conserved hypothetical protein [Ricinus communis]